MRQRDTEAGIRHASCHSQFISRCETDALAMPVASEISALLPRIRLTNNISYGWYLSQWRRLIDGAAVLEGIMARRKGN